MRDAESDDELEQMARDEIDRLEAHEARLLEELRVLLLPRDPNDDRDVILEIRAGAGGEEAALFAAELLPDVRSLRGAPPLHAGGDEPQRDRHRRGQGGDRPDPRRRRLQPPQVRGRRPSRPAHPGDGILRPDPHLDRHRRSSCPRRTRSRSRSTRTGTCASRSSARPAPADSPSTRPTPRCGSPTCRPGLVVEIQDEKSQHKNKAKAMSVLRSRLLERKLAEQRDADSATRRSMVGRAIARTRSAPTTSPRTA